MCNNFVNIFKKWNSRMGAVGRMCAIGKFIGRGIF